MASTPSSKPASTIRDASRIASRIRAVSAARRSSGAAISTASEWGDFGIRPRRLAKGVVTEIQPAAGEARPGDAGPGAGRIALSFLQYVIKAYPDLSDEALDVLWGSTLEQGGGSDPVRLDVRFSRYAVDIVCATPSRQLGEPLDLSSPERRMPGGGSNGKRTFALMTIATSPASTARSAGE